MRFKRITLAVISAALVLTGCSSDNERKPDNPAQTSSNNASSSETNRDEQAFTKGATQLSVKNGAININRRTRSESSPTGENGWTILVYLCGPTSKATVQTALSISKKR